MKFRLFVFFILVIFLTSCEDTDKNLSEPTFEEKLQNILESALETHGGKGISAAILFPDGTMNSAAAGFSHGENKIETSTLFGVGSITKTFTAVSVLKEVEAGTISLDDAIGDWFPNYDHIDSSITIRQLLNHTSGLSDVSVSAVAYISVLSNPGTIFTPDYVLSNFVAEAHFGPGEGWMYSTTNYVLLRALLTKLNETGLDNVMETDIFQPLGLEDTYVYPYQIPVGDIAHGWYDLNFDGSYSDMGSPPWNSLFSVPAGNILSTAEDIARFINALVGERTLLSTQSMDEMLTLEETSWPSGGYGLGIYKFSSDDYDGMTVYGHGGNIPSYRAIMFHVEEIDMSIAILTNTNDGEPLEDIDNIIELVQMELNSED